MEPVTLPNKPFIHPKRTFPNINKSGSWKHNDLSLTPPTSPPFFFLSLSLSLSFWTLTLFQPSLNLILNPACSTRGRGHHFTTLYHFLRPHRSLHPPRHPEPLSPPTLTSLSTPLPLQTSTLPHLPYPAAGYAWLPPLEELSIITHIPQPNGN